MGIIINWIYVCAALIPAVLLLIFIYRKDKIEHEPFGLLAKLFCMGVLAALPALILEECTDILLSPLSPVLGEIGMGILMAVFIGLIEEGVKFFYLYNGSWNNPDFNFQFDAVVYAVFVSLGFAAIENILYVFESGLAVALGRALLAVPGHMAFSVFMGRYVGAAKVCEIRGDRVGVIKNLVIGYLLASLMHGFYDACAMTGTVLSLIIFIVFVIAMYILVFLRIRSDAKQDTSIYY